jgi:hypothetical protein
LPNQIIDKTDAAATAVDNHIEIPTAENNTADAGVLATHPDITAAQEKLDAAIGATLGIMSDGGDLVEHSQLITELAANLQAVRLLHNKELIEDVQRKLADDITRLVDMSGIKGLGQKVLALGWKSSELNTPRGESMVSASVTFNPSAYVKNPNGNGGGDSDKSRINYFVDGVKFTPRQFADKYAEGEERSHSHFVNWPSSEKVGGKIVLRLRDKGHKVDVIRNSDNTAAEATAEEKTTTSD